MQQLKVMPQELALGMYVAELDRPWTETHFLFQGFRLDSEADLRYIKDNCAYVVIDIEKGELPVRLRGLFRTAGASTAATRAGRVVARPAAPEPTTGNRVLSRRGGPRAVTGSAPPPSRLPPRVADYPDLTTVEHEFTAAERALGSVQGAYSDLVNGLRDSATAAADLGPLQDTVAEMQASIVRNPDAMMLLCQLRRHDSYAYRHAINSSVLAVVFGRHLGLKRSQIHDLGVGMLLADVGKVLLPKIILDAPRALSEGERRIVQMHVEHSLRVLERSPELSPGVRQVVQHHHERYNGSGYPAALAGDDIPLLGRMAGIVDTYDAMTSDRVYARGESPLSAIKQLYDLRAVDFQVELVEQFIQALGIYPIGTLVLLSSGEVAVVIGINRMRRLLPKVMVLLDADKKPLTVNRILDLASQDEPETGAEALSIREALPPGAYDIHPDDYYL